MTKRKSKPAAPERLDEIASSLCRALHAEATEDLVREVRGLLRYAGCDYGRRSVTAGCTCVSCRSAQGVWAALDRYDHDREETDNG